MLILHKFHIRFNQKRKKNENYFESYLFIRNTIEINLKIEVIFKNVTIQIAWWLWLSSFLEWTLYPYEYILNYICYIIIVVQYWQ